MQVLVYTCDKTNHLLPGFAYCFNKYWSPRQHVTVLGFSIPSFQLPANFTFHSLASVDDKPFTSYLSPWIIKYAKSHFTFILDDHWAMDYVDLGAVALLEQTMDLGAAKADLSCDALYYYAKRNGLTAELEVKPSSDPTRPPLDWKGSLQPAIWQRDYFLKFINPQGYSPWQVEEEGRKMARTNEDRVIACRYTVYPKPGVEGVTNAGKAHAENLKQLKCEDLQALKELGYRGIDAGELYWELV